MTTAASPEPSLVTEAATFLEADGWMVSLRDPSFIVGSRQGLGEVSDQVLVWVPQEGLNPEQLRLREDGYLRRFEEAARTYAYGQKYLLVESTEGLSADFRRRRVPRVRRDPDGHHRLLRRSIQVGPEPDRGHGGERAAQSRPAGP